VLAEVIRSLYRYNEWANRRILDTSARCSREQLLEGGGASFDSLRDTLLHTMSAQWVYLERWHGRSPRAMPAADDFPDLAAIRARWVAIEHDTAAFVANVDEAASRVSSSTSTCRASAGLIRCGNKWSIR
jgi:uncharacterized damage-inducible protein DinB